MKTGVTSASVRCRRRFEGVSTPSFGVRGHVRALELGDMSPSRKATTCRRTPKTNADWTPEGNGHKVASNESIGRRKARALPLNYRIGRLRMYKPSMFFTGSVIAALLLTGCHTPHGADGSMTDGLALTPFVVLGAIIVSPIYAADKSWELSSDGLKTHVYASPGTTVGDFRRAIDETEGQDCHVDFEKQSNDVMVLKYRGKKAVYYGKFRDAHAIKY